MSTTTPETQHTEEQETEIQRMRDAVRHLRMGGVMTIEDIDLLLAHLDTLDTLEAPPPPDPGVLLVARIGPDGYLHAYEWNPKTRRYDIDKGLAQITASA